MEHSRLTSLSLVDGLKAKDEAYWHRLNSLYGPVVGYWVQQAGVPTDAADDVCQEVLIAVSNGIDSYQHSSDTSATLRRWMWGIARHKIADFLRAENKRVVARGGTHVLWKMQDLPADPFEDSDPDTGVRIRKALISRALGLLESDFAERTWRAFWQTTIEGMPSKEVAEHLEMTPQAVRQARYRVLRRLRDELGDELPE